jgi:hypothetical protein
MSRNRGKPTIRHLSYMIPTHEERNRLFETAIESTSIAAAILGLVIVEQELEDSIRSKFPKIDNDTWSSMLQENGPLATFNQKIAVGFAFRIYDKATRDNLKIISNIRNAFAHSKRLIDFDNELIKRELSKAAIPNFEKRVHRSIHEPTFSPKESYITLCMIITFYLTKRSRDSLKARLKRLKKKSKTPLWNALLGTLGTKDIERLISNPPPSPLSQSAGPNPPTPRGLLSELLRDLEEKEKKAQ